MTINVTQECIDAGIPHDGCRCPVALAILSAYPPGYYVEVSNVYIELYDLEGEFLGYRELREVLCDWTIAFDLGKPVNPFSFELNL